MPKIEIHIITYNEQIMLPFTIAHYKKMFGDPNIIVHDNNSTDDTIKIAEKEGCTVISFTTNGMNDTIHAQIKSQAAMNAQADWVLVIDCDEECFINTDDLLHLEQEGINAVHFQGWNIFDEVSSPWEVKQPMGVLCTAYSKPILLRSHTFQSINFAAGAHSISLSTKEGVPVKWSIDEYKLLHYKHWSCDWNVKRSAELGSRQSEENVNRKHSYHFAFPESLHRDYFKANYDQRIAITDPRI